jgi:eukaryotic-like serine/threonine-protein kinase
MDTAPAATAVFARVRECFHLLLELPADARAAALQRYRDESPALADELQSLLRAMHPADLDAPSSALVSAERIPGYQLRRRIGSGGMGEVWEAERTTGTARQRVAIKLLHGGRSIDEIRARFLREHRILAKLTHAHIAAFIDAGISDSGRAWLAMEFVEGEGLSAWACFCRYAPPYTLRICTWWCIAISSRRT